jgi:hypothetical protein
LLLVFVFVFGRHLGRCSDDAPGSDGSPSGLLLFSVSNGGCFRLE